MFHSTRRSLEELQNRIARLEARFGQQENYWRQQFEEFGRSVTRQTSQVPQERFQLSNATVTLEELVQKVIQGVREDLTIAIANAVREIDMEEVRRKLGDDMYSEIDTEELTNRIVEQLVPPMLVTMGKDDIAQEVARKVLEDDYLDWDDLIEKVSDSIATRLHIGLKTEE